MMHCVIQMDSVLMFVLSTLTTVLIGLLGWIGISFNNRLKDLTKSIDSINSFLGFLKGENMVMEADVEVINEKLKDHENRLRDLKSTQDQCNYCAK